MTKHLESNIPFKTQRHLEWERLCEALALRCKGEPAQEQAIELQPLSSLRAAQKRIHSVDEARSALDALLKIQIDLGVLGSLSILSAATKDLVEETLINLELASEDLLIYRPLASA